MDNRHNKNYCVFLFLFFFSSFIAPVEDLCCKPKYRANIFFIYFFYHCSCCKDQFTVSNLKFTTTV